MILVTPDGHRTMNTFLGAAQHLPASALDEAQIASSAILYLEGYLWDPETPRYAMVRAIEVAREAGRKVAFTLSDTFCVDRHRDGFNELLDGGRIDILFANQAEIEALAGVPHLESAVAAVEGQGRDPGRHPQRGRRARGARRASVPTFPPSRSTELVDTTGAGDLFAAGFLLGQARGLEPRALAAARRDLRRRSDPALRRAPRGGPQGACRRTSRLVAILRRDRRTRHRRNADRSRSVGRKLRHFDDAAADMAVAVAVEEVDHEADHRPRRRTAASIRCSG